MVKQDRRHRALSRPFFVACPSLSHTLSFGRSAARRAKRRRVRAARAPLGSNLRVPPLPTRVVNVAEQRNEPVAGDDLSRNRQQSGP
eukprot:6211050-Pleurochrysis_carterae.AAC.2